MRWRIEAKMATPGDLGYVRVRPYQKGVLRGLRTDRTLDDSTGRGVIL